MSKLSRTFLFVAITTALASAMSLLGGIGLEYVSERILPLVPLLIAIPSMNDLIGDYASIIAAHMGDPTEAAAHRKKLRGSILQVVGVNIVAIIALSLLTARSRGFVASNEFFAKFCLFIIGAVLLSLLLMMSISRFLSLVLRKRHINPDEILIPVVTSIADVVMLLIVSLAVLTIF